MLNVANITKTQILKMIAIKYPDADDVIVDLVGHTIRARCFADPAKDVEDVPGKTNYIEQLELALDVKHLQTIHIDMKTRKVTLKGDNEVVI